MKLIDDSEDYFLHDFNEPAAESQSVEPTPPSAPQPPAEPSSQQFVFEPAPTPAPQPVPAPKPRRRRARWIWVVTVLMAILAGAFYVRYYIPYVTDSKIRGYVITVEKRGLFFRTFEADMISESKIADSSHTLQRDITLSLPNDSMGHVLQSYQGSGRSVVVTVKKYYGTLPWRGSSNTVVTDIAPAR
ncbi:MAG: hypothetical protein J1E29_06240 [Duncaniella sp.]|nr:hypothetical protein [Duncaniella sp.]